MLKFIALNKEICTRAGKDHPTKLIDNIFVNTLCSMDEALSFNLGFQFYNSLTVILL